MLDEMTEVLERVPTKEEKNAAEKTAEYMTGVPKPKFKSAQDRHRTIMENGITSVCKLLQAQNLFLECIFERVGEMQDSLQSIEARMSATPEKNGGDERGT